MSGCCIIDKCNYQTFSYKFPPVSKNWTLSNSSCETIFKSTSILLGNFFGRFGNQHVRKVRSFCLECHHTLIIQPLLLPKYFFFVSTKASLFATIDNLIHWLSNLKTFILILAHTFAKILFRLYQQKQVYLRPVKCLIFERYLQYCQMHLSKVFLQNSGMA